MNWGQAFAAITSVPARIAGMTDVGTLKSGARDVVLWSGDPLELSSLVEHVWIDGVEQSLETRQSRLLRRYLNPQEGALPKAYDR
jgi:imidazolonepropionase-like amidohydrolase